ncbi:MAG: hypothetical protein ACRECV_17650 [Xanthobacteraceae bacterium]
MAGMMVKRLVAVAFAFGVGLTVGSCSSFSDFVSNSWPHFAGGEPNGLPPRPGDPGYNKFIAHGQPQQGDQASAANQPAAAGETAAVASPKPGTAAPAPTAFTVQQNQRPGFQVPPTADGPRNGSSAVSGGLY